MDSAPKWTLREKLPFCGRSRGRSEGGRKGRGMPSSPLPFLPPPRLSHLLQYSWVRAFYWLWIPLLTNAYAYKSLCGWTPHAIGNGITLLDPAILKRICLSRSTTPFCFVLSGEGVAKPETGYRREPSGRLAFQCHERRAGGNFLSSRFQGLGIPCVPHPLYDTCTI